jgi:hypothetical protein
MPFFIYSVLEMIPMNLVEKIKHLHPCSKACEWLSKYTSPAKAWGECKRGDWMLWLLGKLSGEPESDSRKKLVLACCDCARLSLKYTKDPRVLTCIETAENWVNGKATLEELQAARTAAAYAAYAAYAAAAAYAADAAADAYAADAAADAATVAATAATAAAVATATAAVATADIVAAADIVAYAAAAVADAVVVAAADTAAYVTADAYTTARTETLAVCADIVRKHYPKYPAIV